MESKIMIDINYASRSPQIVMNLKESDDPRDRLASMLVGEAMPGVRDGYCRIERYPNENNYVAVITPVHPLDMIRHIPMIGEMAQNNAACDTSAAQELYEKMIEQEYDRIVQARRAGKQPAKETAIG